MLALVYTVGDKDTARRRCSVWQLPVTDKNHITEGLTVKQTIYLLKSRMTPPPLKILNRICIDLKNDPNGPEKTDFR